MSYDITPAENASVRADFEALADAIPGQSRRSFRGVVGGIEYTDPGLFEANARALGFRGPGKREAKWKVGTPVAVRFTDGTRVEGQVWSMADVANYAWIALDNGRYVAVFMPAPEYVKDQPLSKGTVGKVAA